ncbi:MAG TPA: YhbY family RNA-binding protein, partial [Thermofilum sp.]|nr:YhbY family RNA-binding protein [Thermofilum sp.]
YTVRIGKSGLSQGVIKELDKALDVHGLVKVKMLRSFRETAELDRRTLAKKIAEKLGAQLVEVRGFSFVLKRAKKK